MASTEFKNAMDRVSDLAAQVAYAQHKLDGAKEAADALYEATKVMAVQVGPDPVMTMEELEMMLHNNNLIGAIKSVRNRTQLGLKDAKEQCDKVRYWAKEYVAKHSD